MNLNLDAAVVKQRIHISELEDHVWFADWWMVASWCDV
jgi:hypothetical protein